MGFKHGTRAHTGPDSISLIIRSPLSWWRAIAPACNMSRSLLTRANCWKFLWLEVIGSRRRWEVEGLELDEPLQVRLLSLCPEMKRFTFCFYQRIHPSTSSRQWPSLLLPSIEQRSALNMWLCFNHCLQFDWCSVKAEVGRAVIWCLSSDCVTWALFQNLVCSLHKQQSDWNIVVVMLCCWADDIIIL